MPYVITSENDPSATGPAEFPADMGHVELGLSRLIERWRADSHPNIAALLQIYLEQIQELEQAILLTMLSRSLDYAEGVQLDLLGRIVGQLRLGVSDNVYRARIQARIRINRSIGTAPDIIAVLRIVTASAFHFREFGTAAFRLDFDADTEDAGIAQALPDLISDARAAGVSGAVYLPVSDARSKRYGWSGDGALNADVGHSSGYDNTVGGLFSHAARA